MSAHGTSKSKAIRARLSHPVIDSDGHWREFEPIAMDYLRDSAGAKVVEKWTSRFRGLGQGSFEQMSKQERIDTRAGQPPWWGLPIKNGFIPTKVRKLSQGLEKVRDDHLGSLSVDGVALAKCAAEQFLLRAGAPGEGRDNPGQHDHEGRPAAEGERFAHGE